jgi:hypothetical protein
MIKFPGPSACVFQRNLDLDKLPWHRFIACREKCYQSRAKLTEEVDFSRRVRELP